MFPVGEAFFFREKNGFFSDSGHKTAATIVLDFGSGGFVCDGGEGAVTALRCLWGRRWGLAEDEDLMDSEAVEKVRETGSSGMIIGELLCLFLLRKLPILLAPLSFSPLHG